MAQIQPLCPELQKIAVKELGEVPSRISEDLQALKTWIQKQPHLRVRLDDQLLIQFLRGCKYSLERAKEKLDRFYALSSKYTELFSTTDVDDTIFREVHNLGCFLLLPKPLHNTGPRIFFIRINYPGDKYTIEQVLQPCTTMHEVMLLNDPYACIQGIFYMIDFGETHLHHILHFTPSIVKRMVTFLEKSLPFRIKAWCFINVPTLAEPFFRALVPCTSEKLRKRIYIFGKNSTKYQQLIPLKYLPIEYGGDNGSLSQIAKDYNKVWNEYRDYFKENAQYGTEENLRPGKPTDFDSMFGLCGSFRKLDVD